MDNSLFYAYITCTDPSTLNVSCSVMMFLNSSIADEWWRYVSAPYTSESDLDSSPPTTDPQGPTRLAHLLNLDGFITITRTSAQLYVCEFSHRHRPPYDDCDIMHRIFRLKPICEKFKGQLFVRTDSGMTASIIPSQTLTEHISGNWYHIRAKHDRNVHFFTGLDSTIAKKPVTASRKYTTTFRIVGIEVPEGTVLIDSDKIKILLLNEQHLSYDTDDTENKQLIVTQTGKPAEFLFSALGDGSIGKFADYAGNVVKWGLVSIYL